MDRAGGIPRILVSDRLHGFGLAFKKVFWRNKNPQPIHFAEAHIRNERCTNNMHERLNGTISDELLYTRGIKSENSTLIRAYLIHYNFVRPHMALCGRTPADAAGIKMFGTKWQVPIQNAAMAESMAVCAARRDKKQCFDKPCSRIPVGLYGNLSLISQNDSRPVCVRTRMSLDYGHCIVEGT